MNSLDFAEDNNASRLELGKLIERLDEPSFDIEVAPGWTVSSVLCHLAFWDQRVLYLLKKWKSGGFEISRLTPPNVDSLNPAATTIARTVPGPEAARLALASAALVDSAVAETGEKLAG